MQTSSASDHHSYLSSPNESVKTGHWNLHLLPPLLDPNQIYDDAWMNWYCVDLDLVLDSLIDHVLRP